MKEAMKLALEALELCNGSVTVEGVVIYTDLEIAAIKEALAEQPEFIKHEVENADDWSEWVCPNPKGYLMKCCDCGLVHEAQFGVVRYKSETEREDCDMVDDSNLQAVFRMRRSEQWPPVDTAHRAGGLPMEQPKQETVAWTLLLTGKHNGLVGEAGNKFLGAPEYYERVDVYTTPQPAQRKPLTDEQIDAAIKGSKKVDTGYAGWVRDQRREFGRAIEAAHGIKE